MAIKLSANYSKKLGLPNFSSHSFSASVEVELSDLSQAEAEVQKLYQLLQHSVDQEIQNPGFVPQTSANGNGNTNGHGNGRIYPVNGNHNGRAPANGSGNNHAHPRAAADLWNCTEGQRGFILRILNENQIPKQEAEDLAVQLFGIGVKQLNKMQASQLIEELLVKAGKPPRQTRWQPQHPSAQAA